MKEEAIVVTEARRDLDDKGFTKGEFHSFWLREPNLFDMIMGKFIILYDLSRNKHFKYDSWYDFYRDWEILTVSFSNVHYGQGDTNRS